AGAGGAGSRRARGEGSRVRPRRPRRAGGDGRRGGRRPGLAPSLRRPHPRHQDADGRPLAAVALGLTKTFRRPQQLLRILRSTACVEMRTRLRYAVPAALAAAALVAGTASLTGARGAAV